jgi:hypothetical protein
VRLFSFDIDGTLEIGEPPGIIPVTLVRQAQGLGYLVGSCSDRPISFQTAMWERLKIIPDFTVLKHRLGDLKARFEAAAYYHIGDTDIDEHYALLAGFASYARMPARTGRGVPSCSGSGPTRKERAEYPPVRHPLVRTNPVNGRASLFLGAHASHVEGMPIDEGRALLKTLLDHVTQRQFCYRHEWTEGDLVVWDNRCVLHRATPYDTTRHKRLMQRTTVSGDPADPGVLAAGAR